MEVNCLRQLISFKIFLKGTEMKRILVCGAGGFIGHHLVKKLVSQGHHVIGADLYHPAYEKTSAHEFYVVDLRDQRIVKHLLSQAIDEIYQLAADMGGAGYIFTGDNDADIMHNSCQINLNILDSMVDRGIKNVFYTSSACMYPRHNQTDYLTPNLCEDSAYPADPDSEYGWEKLFSERLYMTYARNYNLNCRIARLHNVYGPLGAYDNGREKSPAAICRKVINSNGTVDIWGNGKQTRSFLYIDECITGILKIMESDYDKPLNLGSDYMISINGLTDMVSEIAGKKIKINNVPGPIGVNGRNSDNTLIKSVLGWTPDNNLEYGLKQTYDWIKSRIDNGLTDIK